MTSDELTPALQLPVEDALRLLTHGELQVEGRLVDASNATLYCACSCDGVTAACVYKPIVGERPLWDFPDGTLAEREMAAYEVSTAAGLAIVPPTVLRDGPAGRGMVQLWIDADPAVDVARLMRRRDSAQLRMMAVFDAVINNADRKGGHLLPTPDGHIYGVDHGVSFHVDDKLRTVLWQWAGARFDDEACAMLSNLQAALDTTLAQRLGELLTRAEVRRTIGRVAHLLATGCYAEPGDGWPPVPWPPI